MKSVVCFGDSNTYGSNPHGGRWDGDVRWPRVLQKLLGDGYYVIEEGLGGRETVFDDPLEGERNGYTALPYVLKTHNPIDILIISLGTNDTKTLFSATPKVIAKGLERLVTAALRFPYGMYTVPRILVVSPIHVGDRVSESKFFSFDETSAEKSKRLAPLFKNVADQYGCAFLDASLYAKPSDLDQLHMEKESHLALAEKIAEKVRAM
jgi:lysophospholipase L1-like esterase